MGDSLVTMPQGSKGGQWGLCLRMVAAVGHQNRCSHRLRKECGEASTVFPVENPSVLCADTLCSWLT